MENELILGLYTDVVDIRRKVFVELAKTVLKNDVYNMELMKEEIFKIPYKIISKKDPTYRCCVHKERAVVAERVRLTLGLPLWEGIQSGHPFVGVESVLKPHKVIEKPIVNVISEACEKCPPKKYEVTNECRKCLAHPCSVVCPVGAVTFPHKTADINQEKCIKCGRCLQACPYNAIIKLERPCASVCGVDAIESDETGRAIINKDKCVRCGQCIIGCTFGAIADKSEFVQMLIALKEKRKLVAIIAPSFVGQFGPNVSPGRIVHALSELGFKDILEVAYGADVATMQEAAEWYHKIYEEGKPFLGTSCCPAWVDMAKNNFPEAAEHISDSYTPMVATAKLVKETDKDALIAFIGPCIAKKAEALRPEVSPYVDFVITFEELAAIFVAMDIDLSEIKEEISINHASGSGRGYPKSGGVANALKTNILHDHPDAEVKIATAVLLKECKKTLLLVQNKKIDANLLEGMACFNGCVGGPGIINPIRRTSAEVEKFIKDAECFPAYENKLLKDGE
jgi:[FeFe] hydrogenase (group B1/B3)